MRLGSPGAALTDGHTHTQNFWTDGVCVSLLLRSSARFLNRHLIGPQLTYYHPGRRYCHDYENYAFRSR